MSAYLHFIEFLNGRLGLHTYRHWNLLLEFSYITLPPAGEVARKLVPNTSV